MIIRLTNVTLYVIARKKIKCSNSVQSTLITYVAFFSYFNYLSYCIIFFKPKCFKRNWYIAVWKKWVWIRYFTIKVWMKYIFFNAFTRKQFRSLQTNDIFLYSFIMMAILLIKIEFFMSCLFPCPFFFLNRHSILSSY